MESFIKPKTSILRFLVLLVLLRCVISASQEHIENNELNHHQSIGSRLSLQIVVHGFLLWASMGFLIPVGILTIRLSNREECGRRVRILFFIHATSQIVSVILVTAGAVLSVKNFSNTFDNTHQRIGVALYGLVLLQAVIGFLRPVRGSKRRSVWFFGHWILGTAVSLLGIINVYTGPQAYGKRISRNMKLWIVFYGAEIVCIGALYLFQEKWEYIKKQGAILGNEPTTTIQPTDEQEILNKHKDVC